MSWVRFEHETPQNRKVAALSDAAFRMWFNMIAWSAGAETDGHVEQAIPLELFTRHHKPSQLVRELVSRGLLDEEPDGLFVHDYADYQPSGAAQKAMREADAKRKREARAARVNGARA